MNILRIALLGIRLVMRTKVALFFSFFFPLVWLFVYAGIFGHGNPQSVEYLFGPVVTLNIMGSGFWGLGLQSVMQRERGILRRYRAAPIGAGTIVTSNLLANYLLVLPTVALLILGSVLFFHMPFTMGWVTLLVLVTAGNFAFAGFGLAIASVSNTMQEAQLYNNLVWVTLLFLSGVTIPLPMLPGWIQRVATFLPATYMVTAFQSVMMQHDSLFKHGPEMLSLVVSGLFGLLAAWKLFRWEKEERIPRQAKVWALACVIPFILVGLWMNAFANPTKAWSQTFSMFGSGRSNSSQPGDSGTPIDGFELPKSPADLTNLWVLSTDAARGGNSTAQLSVVSPGAAGTSHALRIEANLAPKANERGFVTLTRSVQVPANAPQGIEFWVKGDSRPVQVRLLLPHYAPQDSPAINFVPSNDWQLVKIPASGIGADGKASKPAKLQIEFSGSGGATTMEIDEIKFY